MPYSSRELKIENYFDHDHFLYFENKANKYLGNKIIKILPYIKDNLQFNQLICGRFL